MLLVVAGGLGDASGMCNLVKTKKAPQATPADLALCLATGVWPGLIAQLPGLCKPDGTEKELCTARHGVAWGAGKHGLGGLLWLAAVALDLGNGQLWPYQVPVSRAQSLAADLFARQPLDGWAVLNGYATHLPVTNGCGRYIKQAGQLRTAAKQLRSVVDEWCYGVHFLILTHHVLNSQTPRVYTFCV